MRRLFTPFVASSCRPNCQSVEPQANSSSYHRTKAHEPAETAECKCWHKADGDNGTRSPDGEWAKKAKAKSHGGETTCLKADCRSHQPNCSHKVPFVAMEREKDSCGTVA